MAVEMVVDSIRMNLLAPHRLVILREVGRNRLLPIVIGVHECDAIAMRLQNASVPRPMTHDLLANMIGAIGGQVTQIVINDLAGDTFFARIILDVGGRHVEVDSRPSDAIALAIRVGVSIFVDEAVLSRGAVDQGGEGTTGVDQPALETTSDPIGEEKLAVFRDLINQLNLDDFGKGGAS